MLSAAASAVGLFFIGVFITLMSGRRPVRSGMRMVLFGLIAVAITFGLGRLTFVGLGWDCLVLGTAGNFGLALPRWCRKDS